MGGLCRCGWQDEAPKYGKPVDDGGGPAARQEAKCLARLAQSLAALEAKIPPALLQ